MQIYRRRDAGAGDPLMVCKVGGVIWHIKSLLMDKVVLTVQLIRYSTAATCTLFIYEFLILLDSEYETIYKSRWTPTKCLYLACRFMPLVGMVVIMYATVADHDMESCGPIVILISIVDMLFPCLPQCLYVIRAWAFTGAQRRSLFVYLPCLFAYLFVVFWHTLYHVTFSKEIFQVLGRTGCFKVFPEPEIMTVNGHRFQLDYPRRMLVAAIVLDVVVGLMVATHCIRIRTHGARLGRLLYTQGLLYFPLMFSLNAAALINASVGSFRGYDVIGYVVTFLISNVMACRFVIQIREYASKDPITYDVLVRVQPERPSARDPSPSLGVSNSLALTNMKRVPPSDSSLGFRNSNPGTN